MRCKRFYVKTGLHTFIINGMFEYSKPETFSDREYFVQM
jgi:hypothetical protein